MSEFRQEEDSLGKMNIPINSLYGASTQRAILNFPISGEVLDPDFIKAYGLIKWAASISNFKLGNLDEKKSKVISKAAQEIYEGKFPEQFPVDVYQTGSGTSTNMNVNEVIANRCAVLLGKKLTDDSRPIHPNDDVNKSQSSNDTFPSAMHISIACALKNELLPELDRLMQSLDRKAVEFDQVVKIGRTHLMDATPITMGQEFKGFVRQLELSIERAKKAIDAVSELPLGGTAVGTGINCPAGFPKIAIDFISSKTGICFQEALNHFESQSAKDSVVECHGFINTINTSLFKIANDIRLLGSGPRCNLGELNLSPIQPGSSIMPGKVNPVVSESITMVASRVFGNNATITWCGANGHLQLNTFMPVMIKCALESIKLTTNGCKVLRIKCIDGLSANKDKCSEYIDYSLAMATSLVPILGYDIASKIAKESLIKGISVYDICVSKINELSKIDAKIDKSYLKKILDPRNMI